MVEPVKIKGYHVPAGESQGFIGLPIRYGKTEHQGVEYPTMETAYKFTTEEALRLLNGELLVLHMIGMPPHPALRFSVGDDE